MLNKFTFNILSLSFSLFFFLNSGVQTAWSHSSTTTLRASSVTVRPASIVVLLKLCLYLLIQSPVLKILKTKHLFVVIFNGHRSGLSMTRRLCFTHCFPFNLLNVLCSPTFVFPALFLAMWEQAHYYSTVVQWRGKLSHFHRDKCTHNATFCILCAGNLWPLFHCLGFPSGRAAWY